MAYIQIDIPFVMVCAILLAFGILIGLYYNYFSSISIATSSSLNLQIKELKAALNAKNKQIESIPLAQPRRIEQIYWDTHCGICNDRYEDIYLREKRNLSVVVLTPCCHTLCTVCFSRLRQQLKPQEQLKCFLCCCNVIFPLQYRIDSRIRPR